MNPWVMLIIGLLAGLALGWLLARRPAGGEASAAEARTEELRAQLVQAAQDAEKLRAQALEAEKAQSAAQARAQALEEAKARLEETFTSAAAKALDANSQRFLTLAGQKLEPLSSTLSEYQQQVQEMEKKRAEEMGTLKERLAGMQVAEEKLGAETGRLVNALRSPQVRGRWGEIALRRAAELAGMAAHCDFVEQVSVSTEDGRLRPDMIVRLPAGREVVVDSKVPLAGFLEALEAKTDAEREAALDRHAAQLRTHVGALANKQYWAQFPRTPEFVVLFIPNDSFLAAAAQRDPSVIEDAMAEGVVIATATTFIALLRAVEYGWRQEQIAASAERIAELGRTLHERIATFLEHMDSVGGGLKRAVKSYNDAVGSLQTRLLPQAEKFDGLGAASQKELPALDVITEAPRAATQRSLPGVGDEDEAAS